LFKCKITHTQNFFSWLEKEGPLKKSPTSILQKLQAKKSNPSQEKDWFLIKSFGEVGISETLNCPPAQLNEFKKLVN